MRSWPQILLFLTVCPLGLLAQTSSPTQRVPIAGIVAKYKKPGVYVFMLDSGHLFLRINAQYSKDKYGDQTYHIIDMTGRELASYTPATPTAKLFEEFYPLSDGSLLFDPGTKTPHYEIWNNHLAVQLSPACKTDCNEELNSSFMQLAIKNGIYCSPLNGDCHSDDFGYSVNVSLLKTALVEQAIALGVHRILPISATEIWFMDKKDRIFYLKSGGIPTEVPGSQWAHFSKDDCTWHLYASGKPRILATCPQGIPMGPDDGIGLFTQVAVFDVSTHTTIARRTGDDYFLSLDGHTLGHLGRHNKYIDLEPLP